MSLFHKITASLREDPLIRRVLLNSGYLFSGNAVSAVLNVAQGILVARLLGDAGLGLLTVIMDFASNTNRLLSFRMSEVVVKYASEALAQEAHGSFHIGAGLSGFALAGAVGGAALCG